MRSHLILALALATAACGCSPNNSNDGGTSGSGDGGGPLPGQCDGSVASTSTPATDVPAAPQITVPAGFGLQVLAAVPRARELAALPNGDLLVGTNGTSVYLVPNATRASGAGEPVVFTTIDDAPVQGVTFVRSSCTIYISSQHGIYAIPYRDGDQQADAGDPIAKVRTGDIPPGSDGDVHTTTSVAFSAGNLYAGVGSSCNACTELDPTRATIQVMDPDGSNMTTRATRFRNAIALAINPATGTLWAGGAGQDGLGLGHPYEFFDAVGTHTGVADYGWPACEENNHAYADGADCSNTVAPRIEMPAYATIVGAVFYPMDPTGDHAFPASYRGGVFLASHGSWHKTNGTYYTPPRVAFVAMDGDTPATPVDWSDPTAQWSEFVGGCQLDDGVTRVARPTGITVGPDGSLFVGDDQNGYVYRIQPN
jgi:glucose/arabinose dehydrogenase